MTLGENIWQVFSSDAPNNLPCSYMPGFRAGYKRQPSASKHRAGGETLLNSYQRIYLLCVEYASWRLFKEPLTL